MKQCNSVIPFPKASVAMLSSVTFGVLLFAGCVSPTAVSGPRAISSNSHFRALEALPIAKAMLAREAGTMSLFRVRLDGSSFQLDSNFKLQFKSANSWAFFFQDQATRKILCITVDRAGKTASTGTTSQVLFNPIPESWKIDVPEICRTVAAKESSAKISNTKSGAMIELAHWQFIEWPAETTTTFAWRVLLDVPERRPNIAFDVLTERWGIIDAMTGAFRIIPGSVWEKEIKNEE